MKPLIKHYPLFSKRMIMAFFFVILVFSCSKNTNDPTNVVVKYCGTIDWKNTIGSSGYFTGSINLGHYNLVAANLTEDGTDNFVAFHRTNGTNKILNDLSGWAKPVIQNATIESLQYARVGPGTKKFPDDGDRFCRKWREERNRYESSKH